MKQYFFWAFALFLFACTPKTADKTATTDDDALPLPPVEEQIAAKKDGVAAQNFRQMAPTPGKAPEIKMGDFEEMTLPNGLKVIVVENHKLPRVSVQLFVDNPPLNEGEQAGMMNIAGDLMGRGTATKSKAELDEAVEFMGANLSTSSSGMFGTSLTKHTETLLGLMQEVLMNPAMSEEEFEKIRKETLSGLATQKTDPNSIASNVRGVINYGKNHPYGEVTTEATVQNITLQDTRDYIKTYFKPNTTYLTMVGDITPDRAKQLAQQYFGQWQGEAPMRKNPPAVTEPSSTQVTFVDKPGAVQSVINVTYPVDLKPGSEDEIAVDLMNGILGAGGFGARLMQNLREDKAYTYGARSSIGSSPYVANFTASASVRNEVTDSSVVQFLYELERIVNEAVTQEELDRAKAQEVGRFARSLDSPNTIARMALNLSRFKLDDDYYEEYLQRVDAVTIEDVQRVAKKYIRPDRANILVVGNKDEVADKLVRFDADGKIDFYDAFGNPIEDKGMTVPAGVTARTVLEDYINAIGGRDNLAKFRDITMDMSAETQFGAIDSKMMMRAPNQMRQVTSMGGAPMQEMVYDGNKGVMKAQGQTVPMDEKMAGGLAEATYPAAELGYLDGRGYQLELKGLDNVEGKKAYKITVETPSGQKSTQYYDMETGLKIRELQSQEGPQGPVTQTIDYDDYRDVQGIKFPYTTKISGGGMPFTLDMKAKSIEMNTGLTDDDFKL